jgi:hypothetical protein
MTKGIIIPDNNYQGYINRSTWLAVLHFDNDGSDIYNKIISFAVESNTLSQFRYKANALLSSTNIRSESSYNEAQIDWDQVWDHYRITD